MAFRFAGSLSELKRHLSDIAQADGWRELNPNQVQYRHEAGVIINWYPTTGTVNLQGKYEAVVRMTPIVERLLRGESVTEEQAESLNTRDTPNDGPPAHAQKYLEGDCTDTELVIALVGAVGTPHGQVVHILKERLATCGYTVTEIRVSGHVIHELYDDIPETFDKGEYERITTYINKGNEARWDSGDNSILALGVCSKIFEQREQDEKNNVKPKSRVAYIINSLKHPEEVSRLRQIYTEGFYLIGVYSDEKRRYEYLTSNKQIGPEDATTLIERDADEVEGHGQHTRDTFHLADFFINLDYDHDRLERSLWRVLDLVFGHPYITPSFHEYAMFMAFASALRSADLSRQIGAVIARDKEILATGANDCPKAGGGLYWPSYSPDSHDYVDAPDGRDYMRGEDSNRVEQQKIIAEVVSKLPADVDKRTVEKALLESRIRDLTEYGRVVHAEMEALLFCARNSVDTRKATLYTTTFPCHNCAKHIIAAGIERVVYVEPYPKSKAFQFHTDAISSQSQAGRQTVLFTPFVGVGPRKFFDLFSMRLSAGREIIRKDNDGSILQWRMEGSSARMQMLACSYLEKETIATMKFADYKERLESRDGQAAGQ